MARVWFLLALLPPWKGGRALCLTHRICQFPLLLRTHCLFGDSLPENAFILLSLLRSPLSWFLQLFPGLPRGLLCSEVYGERARKRPRTCTLSLAIFPLKCVFQCSFCVCVGGGIYTQPLFAAWVKCHLTKPSFYDQEAARFFWKPLDVLMMA